MSQNLSNANTGGAGGDTVATGAPLPTGTQPTGTETSATADGALAGTTDGGDTSTGAPLGGDDRVALVVKQLREEGGATVAELAPEVEGGTAHLTLPAVPQDLSHVDGVIVDEDRVKAALMERRARLDPNPSEDTEVTPGVTVKTLREQHSGAGVEDTRRVEVVNEHDEDDPHKPNALSGATVYTRTVIEEPAAQVGEAETKAIDQQQVEETDEEIRNAETASDAVREGESPRDAITRAQDTTADRQTADDDQS